MGQHNGLIGAQSRRPVDRSRIAPLETDTFLCAGNEESQGRMDPVKSREIETDTIHHVERPRLRDDRVENLHAGRFRGGNLDKCWDRAAQVEKRVDFDSGGSGRKSRPAKQGQTEFDGSCRSTAARSELET